MLFPSKAIFEARRKLFADLEAGTITMMQAFEGSLALDPFDVWSLMRIGHLHFHDGNLAGAEEFAWRAVSADPCRCEPWYLLVECVTDRPEYADLENGILELTMRKTLRSEAGLEEFQEVVSRNPLFAGLPDTSVALEGMSQLYAEKVAQGPEEVRERLKPHHLVDELLQDASDGLDPELVDRIVAEGARIAPLLVGVLRAMATESLPEDNITAAEAAAALLGEIGDPGTLPELLECCAVDDEYVQAAADWGVLRMAERKPAEVFEAMEKAASLPDVQMRLAVGAVASHMPDQVRLREIVLSLLDGLEGFPKADRHEIFVRAAEAFLLIDRQGGSELVRALLKRYDSLLPRRTRSMVREIEDLTKLLNSQGEERIEPIRPTVYDFCMGDDEEGEDEDNEEDDDVAEDDPDEDDDEFDEDDFIPAPVVRPPAPGRNDPCWCGSGKKYKKCHLEADEQQTRQPPAGKPQLAPALGHSLGHAVEESLRRRLVEFAPGAVSKREAEQAVAMFVGPEPLHGSSDMDVALEITDWMVHDYVSPRTGRSMIEEFLRRAPGGLTPADRRMLEEWSHSRFSVFEVQEVREGSGVVFKDLLVGDRFFVEDVNTSRAASIWDCYLARVEDTAGHKYLTAVVLSIPRSVVAPLLDWAIGEHTRSGLSWDAFLRANSHRLRQRASGLLKKPAPTPRVLSAEGDPMVFSRAMYELLDEDALRGALDASEAFERVEEGYTWLEPEAAGASGRRILGTVKISGQRVTLECTTRQRLDRGKALLGRLAGAALRPLGDEFTSVESALRNRDRAAPAPSGLPPEVERELIGKMYEDHYTKWLDMKLPALDGRTPREAAAMPEMRSALVDLLKYIENGEALKRKAGEPSYDVSRLKVKLGVDF
jgi:hypothetical protein